MPKDLSTRLLQAGEGINQGLSQVGSSIKEMDPEKIKADALQRQQALALQHQQLQAGQMKMMEMQKDIANKGINDIIVQGLQLDDPKAFDAYMNDRQPQLNQYYNMKGQAFSPSTFDMLKTSSEDYKVARGNLNMLYNKVLSNRLANKYAPLDVSAEQLSRLKSQLSKGPSELYQQDLQQLGEIQSLAQEQSKAQFGLQEKLQLAQNKGEVQSGAVDKKQSQNDEKLVNQTIDTVEGLTRVGAQGPLQMANKRVSLANDGLRLVSQIQSGKVKGNRSVETELARNIDGLVSVNQGSAELVKDMINKTIYSKYASVAEWLKSSPQNHIPPAFLDNYKEQMSGQRDYWQAQRAQVLDAQAEKLQGAFSRNPELKSRWDKSLGKFAPDYVQGGQAAALSDADQQAIAWAKANPKDPRAQKILSLHPGQ